MDFIVYFTFVSSCPHSYTTTCELLFDQSRHLDYTPYSSKFSWHNIFVNFVISLLITKIFLTKIQHYCGRSYVVCARASRFQHAYVHDRIAAIEDGSESVRLLSETELEHIRTDPFLAND